MPQVLKDDIRKRILAEAVSEFTGRGYERASMKDIAGRCGIAVGNIYRYFRNKQHLYDAIAMPVYESINRLFETPPESYSITAIEKKIGMFIDIYRKNRDVFMMLLRNSGNSGFSDMNKRLIEKFTAAILRWKEKMSGTGTDPGDVIFVRAFSTAYINGIISILTEEADEGVVSARLYDFLFFMKDGLFSKYGHKQPRTDGA